MDNIISAAFGLIVILIVLIILGSCIKVVPQSRAFVVERLGAFPHPCGAWDCTSRSPCSSGWPRTCL